MAINITKKNGETKLYEQVHERLSKFRTDYPVTTGWGISSEILVNDERRVAIVTRIISPEGKTIADGYAEELRGSSDVNKTSAMENCETSSLGRALFKAGYGNGEICSAEELLSALQGQAALQGAKVQPAQQQNVTSNQKPNPKNTPANASSNQGKPASGNSRPQQKAGPSQANVVPLADLDPKIINLFKKAGITPIAVSNVNYAFDGKVLMIHGPGTTAKKSEYSKAGFRWNGKLMEKGAWCKPAA